ncbi:uncharacterized protein FOMMEDRAFT_152045 [Fomitiporia mediterranea MF3/22]|uniref:uncharacterized protein n=1 Tax=Fomitiporia mediterranea (strain MF3/22) TaxID=694068 RepID=UPI0004407333|nr:uncharacterized protein FOMMEDRAFT_152045 [Fomitiporia mediterranea MF3/22]EJD06739.1 hypothetical protein FOMMEDRAFT_152045 [Fomitiporia mediterranea MF3/22]
MHIQSKTPSYQHKKSSFSFEKQLIGGHRRGMVSYSMLSGKSLSRPVAISKLVSTGAVLTGINENDLRDKALVQRCAGPRERRFILALETPCCTVTNFSIVDPPPRKEMINKLYRFNQSNPDRGRDSSTILRIQLTAEGDSSLWHKPVSIVIKDSLAVSKERKKSYLKVMEECIYDDWKPHGILAARSRYTLQMNRESR